MRQHKHKGISRLHPVEQQHKDAEASKAHNKEVKEWTEQNDRKQMLADYREAEMVVETPINDTPLGSKMRDKVTGFEGIAVAKVTFLNGCVQFSLKPDKLDKEGKTIEAVTIDSQQLEVIGPGLNKDKPKPKEEKKPTGGDMPDAPDLSYL